MSIDIETIRLEIGAHSEQSKRFCVMELAAYLSHEPFSDHPKCASPVIAAFLRSWNDALDDETRQKLKPYAERVIGTDGSPELEEQRAFRALDWLIRTQTAAWLRLAKLTKHAEVLETLPPQTSVEALASSAAAWDAARDAARAAARDAAYTRFNAELERHLMELINTPAEPIVQVLDQA